MSKHTPGPWVNTGNGIHSGTRCVATTHMNPKEQRDIDARLIAAAPDLLEALKDLCSHINETRGSNADNALFAARLAIAKATGENQC